MIYFQGKGEGKGERRDVGKSGKPGKTQSTGLLIFLYMLWKPVEL